MTRVDWQLIVVLPVLAGSVFFLVRRAVRFFRAGQKGGGACGSCGSCAPGQSAASGTPTVLVPLESRPPDDQARR